VERRLAPRSGIFLSGGLDSVTVAAYASDLQGERGDAPLGLSLVFPDEVDESPVQTSVAASLGLPLVIRPIADAVGERGVFGAAVDLAATWPAPLLNVWLPAYISLAQEARRRGVTAILTGGGGDEWLTASPFYIADLMRAGKFRALARFIATHQRSYTEPTPALLYRDLWQFGARALLVDALRPAIRGPARRLVRARLDRILPPWLAPDRRLRAELHSRSTISLSPREHGTFYGREMRTALTHALIDHEMEEFHEAGQRSAVEIAQPFWDRDLLELLYRVHPEALLRHGRSKGLVRDTLEARFPGRGFAEQRKLSATSYLSRLALTEGAAERRRFGRIEALGDLGVLDPAGVEAELDRVVSEQDGSRAWWIWFILSFEAWARERA
jgi:asparagine synthetase B (glutamine-hydrolysing)